MPLSPILATCSKMHSPMSKTEWQCDKCGSNEVHLMAWVDANTNRPTGDEAPLEGVENNYCCRCCDHCELAEVEVSDD